MRSQVPSLTCLPALFALPGYSLKGFEKELSKRHLTQLKGEILLIRVRQAANELRHATATERQQVINQWKAL